MEFSGAQTLAMPLEAAWMFLLDVNNVARCVPGFQTLQVLAPDRWQANISISVGFVKANVPVEITRPVVEEARHIVVQARGKASGSSVEMLGDMSLSASGPSETRMDWKATVNVGGLLSRLGKGLLTTTMQQSTNSFFAALTKDMESSSKGELPPAPTTATTNTSLVSNGTVTPRTTATALAAERVMWRWPWYLIAGVAAIGMGILPHNATPVAGYSLLIFALLALLVMLIERIPEVLLVPAGLAAWAISRLPVDTASTLLLYSLLCVLIFVSRFLWKSVTAKNLLVSPVWFPALLALGGQVLVVVIAIRDGGLTTSHPPFLIYAGAGTLLVLTILITWSGYLLLDRPVLQHCCYYAAGLLVGLVISWFLAAVLQNRDRSFEYFTIAPAISLSVIAPFIMSDRTLPGFRSIGQFVAVIATIVLLLPTSVASVSTTPNSWIPILLLLVEASGLFLFGLPAQIPFFKYSGAALVMIGVVRALVFVIQNPNSSHNNLIIATVVISAIVLTAVGIFFLVRDSRKNI